MFGHMRIVMLGDIVGACGRQSVQQLVPRIHEEFSPDLVLANAENVANGSGLTPDQYRFGPVRNGREQYHLEYASSLFVQGLRPR